MAQKYGIYGHVAISNHYYCIKQTPYHVDEICHGILWQMHLDEKLHLKSQLYLSSLTFTLTSWMF
jgi:hypothetical protein